MAPEDLGTIKKYRNCLDAALEAGQTTTVEVTGGAGVGGNGHASSNTPIKQDNTTDEEKVFIQHKATTAGKALPVPGHGLEGQFVEGRLEKSLTPFVSKVLVTADVNPQS